MATWNDLQAELDQWGAEGREATIWWRDDDAIATVVGILKQRFGERLQTGHSMRDPR